MAVAAVAGAPPGQWWLLALVPAAGLMPPDTGWAVLSSATGVAALAYASYTRDVIPAWNGAALAAAALAMAAERAPVSALLPRGTALLWMVWRAVAVAVIARIAGEAWLVVVAVAVMLPPLAMRGNPA